MTTQQTLALMGRIFLPGSILKPFTVGDQQVAEISAETIALAKAAAEQSNAKEG